MTSPALMGVSAPDSPLLSLRDGEDSALQAALRGGPRSGEDWSVQSLLEVCLQRIEEAGCRGAVSDQDMRGNRLLVVTDTEGHRLAAAVAYGLVSDNWVEAGARRNRRLRSINPTLVRRDLLDRIADNLAVKPHYLQTLAALFAEPYDSAWLPHERLHTALALWWQARLDDGHTIQSATTMLGLLAHPTVMTKVAYRRTDGCPRLH